MGSFMPSAKHTPVIEKIQFSSAGYDLNGYLHLPPAAHPPVVIGSHGLFSDKDSPKQIALAQNCNQSDMAYFRFDHRGCGESKAPLKIITSLEARCQDLKAAVKMLTSRRDLSDITGFFGSSMGGSVCLSVARDLKALAVVTWAAPLRSTDLVSQSDESGDKPLSPFHKQPFDVAPLIAGLRNTLIIHGNGDETVPLSHAEEIYSRIGDPKKLLVLPGSDHRMSNPNNQQIFLKEATLWLQTFLALD